MIKTTRRQFTALAAAAAATTLLGAAAKAQDAYTLKIHSFSGPQAPEAINMVLPFIEAVEEQSGGRLKMEFYPSMQLGGSASDLVEQMEDQVVDIIVAIPGLTPGRFSGLEGMDMPFTNVGTSQGQTAALLDFTNKYLLDNEFKGIKILHMHGTDAAVIHTTETQIESMDDMKGLKLRAPGRYTGEAVKALGGTPVGLSLGETYEALERSQVDGMTINWAIMTPYKLQEVSKYHMENPLYQNSIFVLMNQDSFDALPEDLQKVIDDNIGFDKSVEIAGNIDKLTDAAKATISEEGGVLYSVSDEEIEKWKEAVRPVYQIWIDEMDKRGLPGQEMFDDIMALTAKYGRPE
ncbi:TRAP transporter substrate-binding protein [Mangrovicoccus algicola]|uniref:TRAP transporter substrate-binding protein n=1 Tax=Mangrovicoccus algicola TaxID=2771008 RepID=A0A8J6YPT4_9RHOB|nr:TRAP transporter substrate-binding protein [Mangrovicoccus algicola]MBE3637248.1 TRAP transporter substrate-binding protein [Mangrovicoccus algicola]